MERICQVEMEMIRVVPMYYMSVMFRYIDPFVFLEFSILTKTEITLFLKWELPPVLIIDFH